MEYFARIQEPKKLRLSMMKTARESIVMMALIEEVEIIREQKLELIDSLKEDFDCITKFYGDMANLMGDEKTRSEIIKTAAKEDVPSKPRTKAKVSEQKEAHSLEKSKTDVDRLEYTLKQIEDRIAQLSE